MCKQARHSDAKGEVSGAFLLGLMNSFQELHVLSADSSVWKLGNVDPAGWYPYGQVMDLIHEIRAEVPRAGGIFFRAGVNFIRLWYDFGPGKNMVHSGRDWLFANQDSAGYNSVVRGGSRDEIGWCVIQEINEDAGYVIYDNVTPLSPEYVQGVFYGGCLLFDDMDYIDVAVSSEEFPPNPHFIRTTVKLNFRFKPKGSSLDLEQLAEEGMRSSLADFSQENIRRILWRYKSIKVRHALDSQYLREINVMLVNANRKSLELAEELKLRVKELESALHRVRSLEGLLPICAWCKRMRESDSSWVSVEQFVGSRTSAAFSHTICPQCERKLFG